MDRIQKDFNLKDNKIEPPGVYLGEILANMKLDSSKYYWTISPEQYVKAAVTNVENNLAISGKILLPKCNLLLSINYAPWMEDFPAMMAEGVKQYQELIVRIRWTVEIGRMDILLETLMLVMGGSQT